MAKVSIANVEVLEAEAPFSSAYRFRITFDANEELPDDLEWKITYVGCAESNDYDQVLDSILVGPVPCGRHVFVFDAPAPDATRIPSCELIGVTVVLLTCAYREQEFVRIGYFVRVEYDDPEMHENPPAQPVYERLKRVLLADAPRVTRLTIKWNGDTTQDTGDLAADGASTSGAPANEAEDSALAATASDAGNAQTCEKEAVASESDSCSVSRAGDCQTVKESETTTAKTETAKPESDAAALAKSEVVSETTELNTHTSSTNGNGDASDAQDDVSPSTSDQNGDHDDEVARKRAKMDQANANGLSAPIDAAAN